MNEFQTQRFGKYILLDRIAVGGMAEVFRGKITGEQGFEKLVVIKKMLPHLTSDRTMVDHFVDEAKLAALFQHENIVHVYDFGEIDGGYFIAMEYLTGKDLKFISTKLTQEEQKLPLDYILQFTANICEGLDYAHNLKDLYGTPLNFVHRDVSPQNIYITYDGKIKILDFGIAKTVSQGERTQVGTIKGKVAYMSPEQAASQPLDRRSDVFSVGILLYEMMAGQRMFDGETYQVLARVADADFIAPEEAARDGLMPLTASCTRPWPKHRKSATRPAGRCAMILTISGGRKAFALLPETFRCTCLTFLQRSTPGNSCGFRKCSNAASKRFP